MGISSGCLYSLNGLHEAAVNGGEALEMLQRRIVLNISRDSYGARTTLDSYIDHGEHISEIFAHYPQLLDGALLEELSKCIQASSITLYDHTGKEIVSSGGYIDMALGTDAESTTYDFRRILKGVPYIVHEAEKDETTGLTQVRIGIRTGDPEAPGKYGVMLISLDPAVIEQAAEEVALGQLDDHFPLVVWQTGSGTHSNMNANEVIANRANELAGSKLCHPNDDINMSQSSNDCFPTAMRIASVLSLERNLLPAVEKLIDVMLKKEEESREVLKCGRTHLQDAVPIRFSQEISGWRSSLERDAELLRLALPPLRELALGGTAVGTGLSAPAGFAEQAAEEIAQLAGTAFVTAPNKFHALTSLDELVFAHGAMKALASDMMKIANDIRFLASGPRCGYGELRIPANEPGSSIMPGKVNPTQCEQVTMVAVQVMGNDAAIGFAASQGNFELNVFQPVVAYNFLQSARLLTESISAFNRFCFAGLEPDTEVMRGYLERTLMTATALNPVIGYENAARAARLAHESNITLKEACLRLGFLDAEHFDDLVRPENMV